MNGVIPKEEEYKSKHKVFKNEQQIHMQTFYSFTDNNKNKSCSDAKKKYEKEKYLGLRKKNNMKQKSI